MVQANIERAKEIAHNIRAWIAERDTQRDFYDWIQTTGPKALKGVKRKELAKLLGISTSTLNANEAAAELKNAEYRWTATYVSKDVDSKAIKAETQREINAEKRAKSKASKLEGENTALQVENRLLRSRLRQYEAIDELLLKTARAPRRPLEGD